MMARLVPDAHFSAPSGEKPRRVGYYRGNRNLERSLFCLGKVRRRDLSRMKLSHVFIPLSNDRRVCAGLLPWIHAVRPVAVVRPPRSFFTKCETFALLGNPIEAALQRSRGERLCDVRAWILSRSAFCKSWLIGASNGRREACCHLPAS